MEIEQEAWTMEPCDIMDNLSDDSVADKDFIPPSPRIRISESDRSDSSSEIQNNSNTRSNSKPKTRKRQRNEKEWKCNKRKEAKNQGLEHINTRNKRVPAKTVQTNKDCLQNCRFKCSQKVTKEEQLSIFSEYYSLTREEKKMFLLTNTSCVHPQRRRKFKTSENSKKKQSFAFYFTVKSIKINVCKRFFLDTLSISQKQIYNVHKTKNTDSNTPARSKQGKHIKRATSAEDKQFVKDHINSFPRVPSHYCRKDSSREYLERFLNMTKMYNLYKDLCKKEKKKPVKKEVYRRIFCNDFNLYFHKPKKDRCDLCEEEDVNNKEGNLNTPDLQEKINRHRIEKEAARENRNIDRTNDIPVLCFDLENVLSCPKAEVSNFFYKSKFATYNMTAHLSTNKKVYCAIWTEAIAGRSGNDIASAVCAILKKVLLDNPHFTSIIMWSDSCVPQNRNSIMSYALANTMINFPVLEQVVMKFSTPGHSCVQEIDNVHSCIDQVLSKAEYYSPISLMRLLKQVNTNKPYSIMQLNSNNFFNYQEASSLLQYSLIPFTKVTELKFTKSWFEVGYKCSHTEINYKTVNLKPLITRKSTNNFSATIKLMKKPLLSNAKINTIKSMYRWMPTVDKEYYEAIFKK